MKKILILVLALSLAVLVFCSCAKKDAQQKALSYKVYNRSGQTVTELRVSNPSGTSSMTCRNIADGTDITAQIKAADGEDVTLTVTMGGITTPFHVSQDVRAVTLLAGPDISYAPPRE